MAGIFDEIVGHGNIITGLRKVLAEGKIGHAYLFTGPAGVGKKTLAMALTAQLLCERWKAGSASVPCECSSCHRLRAGNHPDFHMVAAAGNSIKIEQLRELQRSIYYPPLEGRHRIFFFPDAEKLTEAAANSFLKLLEEPPPGVIFLFTAVRADHLLPTIRSRCQIYQLFPISPELIQSWLEKKGIPREEALRRSQACEGLPGKALEAGAKKDSDLDLPVDLEEILGLDLLALFKITSELEKKDRQVVLTLLHEWESRVRSSLLQLVDREPERRKMVERLVFVLEKLAETQKMLEHNVNQRLALEEFLLAVKIRG
ncbi:MAG: DNA polymerase III subunit delta' [Firmicutes bacterium]|nr:DNA polymerase III subunit delta' [Bacillota bacterium]